MSLSRINNILDGVLKEFIDDRIWGSPKENLKKAGYEIVNGKMDAKARRIVRKFAGPLAVAVLNKLGHTIKAVEA
ncbi:hypothetical protein E2P64_08160 [Candidatus Bathyarchaeota archaeon]|nr:hypothetical protein E2P64_08160 [Candidatus Bathyarchaeota archaeon]